MSEHGWQPLVVPHGDTPMGLAFRRRTYTARDGTIWLMALDGWFPTSAAVSHDHMAEFIKADTTEEDGLLNAMAEAGRRGGESPDRPGSSGDGGC